MTVYHSQDKWDNTKPSLFLAGSVEMGDAEDWQEKVINRLDNDGIIILNPRRPDWGADWMASMKDDVFLDHLEWELSSMDRSDVILIYFAPETKSGISLLELGIYANSDKKLVVCCPDGFWCKGYIEIICEKYGIMLFNTITKTTELLRLLLSLTPNRKKSK